SARAARARRRQPADPAAARSTALRSGRGVRRDPAAVDARGAGSVGLSGGAADDAGAVGCSRSRPTAGRDVAAGRGRLRRAWPNACLEPLAAIVVRKLMRRYGPLLPSLLTGCYLFSDEPKARKQPGSEVGQDPDEAAPDKPEPPRPEGSVADCPEFLTGVEAQARTIAASCPPVRVRGQYRIDGGTLTLEAGVELRFEQNAILEVGRDRPGTLTIAGTPEQPVRRLADMVGEVGGWQSLRLHAQATGSSLKHLEITGAGTATDAALWIAAEDLTVEGLTIRDAPALALEVVA